MVGKSTLDQIHVVKQIIEKSHEFDKYVRLLFVDFKAAYDSANRERPWKVPLPLPIGDTKKDHKSDSSMCEWAEMQSQV